ALAGWLFAALEPRPAAFAIVAGARALLLLLHLLDLMALQELLAGGTHLRLLHPVMRVEVAQRIGDELLAVLARPEVSRERPVRLERGAGGHRVAQFLHLPFGPAALRLLGRRQLSLLEMDA